MPCLLYTSGPGSNAGDIDLWVAGEHEQRGNLVPGDLCLLQQVQIAGRDVYKRQFQVYLKVHGKQISNFLDANTVQKIASQAWKGVSSVLFGKGKRLHYKKVEEFRSLEGKTNRQGIRYDTKKGCLIWGSRRIPIQVRGNDKWAQRALSDRVKYCRVVAKWHKTQMCIRDRWQCACRTKQV